MENNSSAADESGEVRIDILREVNEEYSSISQQDGECCIYKIPNILREVNEEAYTPQIIAIGPYHHSNKKLAAMEEHKIRYKEEFDQRITPDKREKLMNFVREHETEIRRHYSEPCSFSTDTFVKMIVFDAVFIIQLFRTCSLPDSSDFLLQKIWLGAIRRDLQLLENQLPYFVLEELYKIAFPSIRCQSCGASLTQCSSSETSVNNDEEFPTFRNLSCVFFGLSNEAPYDQGIKIKHFTDLCRRALVGKSKFTRKPGPINKVKELPNAVKLRKSGVKFGGVQESDKYLVDSKVEKRRSRLISFFNKVELKMPHINVYDDTECLIRNVMALEQCHYPSETYICGYIELMDFLIENEEDVDYLVKNGVIYNYVGSNAVVADVFNKLCRHIPSSIAYYSDICDDLKDHYDNRWNHNMTNLKSTYFSNLWRGTATVAAIIILLLTLTQTVFSILQVVLPK